ncbi:MAG: hypothetical protein HY906_05125 [Deltaproteobacteria bacterium]|nr:hypothetical protein [Deltaproteobacteria bacterium]
MSAAPRPMTRRLARLPLLCLVVCSAPWLACSDATTSVNLVLTTNPDLCSAAEVLDQVATVVVVVDAPGGLQGVSVPGPTRGGGTAVDFDGDGELEVLFQAPLQGPALPILEVGLSHNADRELSYRVLGFPAGVATEPENAIALGGVQASCPAGEVRKVGTPFNLRAVARPPKVILVLPPDGATEVPPNLRSVTVVFSTTVTAASLAGAVRLVGPDGADRAITSALDTLTYAGEGGIDEQRSLLTVDLVDAIEPAGPGADTFTVVVGPGISSTTGRAFDQDPATAAADGFTSHFQIGSGVGGGGHPCDSCSSGYLCNDDETGCVPALDCARGCEAGFVCDPGSAQCLEDCRLYGACAAPGLTCEAQTGLCG